MKLQQRTVPVFAICLVFLALPTGALATGNSPTGGLPVFFQHVRGGSQEHVRGPNDDFSSPGTAHERDVDHERGDRGFLVVPNPGGDPFWWGSPLYPGDPYNSAPSPPLYYCENPRGYYPDLDSCPGGERQKETPDGESPSGADTR